MHPSKKLKLDSSLSSDPFDDEDDWDEDDAILKLVAEEIPTCSQMSQALKATPINGHSSNTGGKARSFVFKRPSATASSVLSTKPTRYNNTVVNDSSILVNDSLLNSSTLDASCTASATGNLSNSTLNGTASTSKSTSSSELSLTDMVRKQHAHEGEIKWLRSTLKEKDTQINTLRTNYNADKAKQKLEHSERERGFVKDIESLRSELQFKESELMSVTQALDRMKREKSRPVQPSLRLDGDGFPVSTSFQGSKSALVKSEPMEVSASTSRFNSTAASKSRVKMETAKQDTLTLKPANSDRLVPRKLTASEFKRRLCVSDMLRDNLDKCTADGGVSSKELLGQAIACAKDLCYL